ncbi:uncharacterized protein LTR77_004250 [Saxophila tyrrhenica]|uniref:Uncharacterized protein n=1 Tax=Saxophila tyrrhenica TaxID=1690608 RepID=A0AAV9PCM9_9PEZI|nr:hypothetical protein LTR77_004250 [Saxophila tyrrhenica]
MSTNTEAAPLSLQYDIPRELRDMIWEFAVVEDITIPLGSRIVEPGLLLVSKQVREEAVSIFYKKSTFAIEVSDCKYTTLSRTLSRLERQTTNRMTNVRTYVLSKKPHWPNLLDSLKFVHARLNGIFRFTWVGQPIAGTKP